MKLAIFNTEQQYHDDLESFCDKNCILQVLDYYGVRNPLLYIETALNIHLFEDKTKPIGYNINFDETYLIGTYNNKLIKHTPIDKTELQTWQENKLKLKEGIPVITGIDIFHLNYSSNYKLYHSNHKCILGGYSNDEKFASVIDYYEWKYRGDILIEDFLRARSSVCPADDSPYSGYPIENEWLEIEDSNWSIDIRNTVKGTIDKVVKNYYENGLTNYKTDFHGIAAMQKIYELFDENKDLNPTDKSELIANIRVIFLFLYTRKKLFRYYISEASNLINIGLLPDLLNSLNEDIELWRKTTIIMLKASVSVSEKSYNKIAGRMKELIDLEEKRYHLLAQLSLAL